MKKLTTILIIAALAALALAALPSAAFANAGPHGGYIANTEACAGCHRAHTAPSSITWVDATSPTPRTRSALLLSTATRLDQFCLVCHDASSQGGDTNVVDGVYEGMTGVNGTPNGMLLGGAFGRFDPAGPQGPGQYDGNGDLVSSTHTYWFDGTNGMWQAWGGGAFGSTSTVDASGNVNAVSFLGGGAKIAMDCGTCHDPHGSSNYRILKDTVYGVAVGGYDGSISATDPNPTPYVISAEVGYPTGGFRLHTQYAAYVPNYTEAAYAKAPGGDTSKGMVGWCVGCHTVYATLESTYNAGDAFGFTNRHRHPVNVPLSNFAGPRSLIVTDNPLPLAHDTAEAGALTNTSSDWVDCLTCHNAHGASTVMTGYANVANSADPLPNSGSGGVDPTQDSALLKLNNRGVCEACHNK